MTASASTTYARAGAYSLVAHVVQLVGAMALSVVLVRMLSLEALGELTLGRQLAALLAIGGSLALERTVVRFVPELVERGDLGAARGLVLRLLQARLVAGTALALAVILFREPVAGLIGIADPATVVVAAVTSLAFSVGAHMRAGANAWFRADRVAQAAILASLLTLGMSVAAVKLGYGVVMILSVAGIAALVGALWTWPASLGPGGPVEGTPTRERLASYTVPFAIIVLMNQLVHSQTEVFFLGRLRSPAEAAWFQYGFVLAQRIVDFLPLALWEVSMAAFAREDTAGVRDLREASYRYLRLTYVVILPVTAIGVVMSPLAVDVLYGAKMQPAVMVAQAYFVLGAVAAFGAPMGMILYAREATGLVLRIYLVGTVLNLGLDWWLVSEYGLTGAVVGLAVAKCFLVGAMAIAASRRVGGIRVPFRTIVLATAGSAGAGLWWFAGSTKGGALWLVAGILTCSALVLVAYRAMRVLHAEDLRLIEQAGGPAGAAVVWLLGGRRSHE